MLLFLGGDNTSPGLGMSGTNKAQYIILMISLT